MKWSHLPVPGGIYAQDPKLLDEWTYIMGAESREEAAKAARQKQQSSGRFRGRR